MSEATRIAQKLSSVAEELDKGQFRVLIIVESAEESVVASNVKEFECKVAMTSHALYEMTVKKLVG